EASRNRPRKRQLLSSGILHENDAGPESRLDHIRVVKQEHQVTDERRVRDEKAFAIIAQGVKDEHQSKLCHATSKRHEFKMDTGSSMANHLDRFGELVVSMEAVGDPLDQERQMILGSMSAKYETIVTVIENTRDVTLAEVKKKSLTKYVKLQTSESTEGAFKARRHGRRQIDRRAPNKQRGKTKQPKTACAFCKIPGHSEEECRKKKKQQGGETLFVARAHRERNNSWGEKVR
ncbi:TPA: hypothetical protein N0F65_000157, partial [Lagenidium giganteum]